MREAEAANRQTAERVFRAINGRGVTLFHDRFHGYSVIEFPPRGRSDVLLGGAV
jgi:hypothetical protein